MNCDHLAIALQERSSEQTIRRSDLASVELNCPAFTVAAPDGNPSLVVLGLPPISWGYLASRLLTTLASTVKRQPRKRQAKQQPAAGKRRLTENKTDEEKKQ